MSEEILIDILIVIAKVIIAVFCFLLPLTVFNTWFERKVSALIQSRIGVNRSKIFGFDLAGFVNTFLADPIKSFFKEDIIPNGASRILHTIAPIVAVFPILLCVAIIPFGPDFELFGRTIKMQVVNLNVALLFIFACISLAIFGQILAGRVSQSKFALLGSFRAVLQSISCGIIFGLGIIPLICIYKTLNLNEIVLFQGQDFHGLPAWGFFLNPISFFVFLAAAMVGTYRAPFDISDAESGITTGYLAEYSGMKFILFRYGQFASIVIVSSLLVLLFFGGWQIPYFDLTTIRSDLWGILPEWFNEVEFTWAPLVAFAVFVIKVIFFCVLQILVRWTLPRFSYDQLIYFCWKTLITISILNIVVSGALVLGGFYEVKN